MNAMLNLDKRNLKYSRLQRRRGVHSARLTMWMQIQVIVWLLRLDKGDNKDIMWDIHPAQCTDVLL